MDVQELLRPIAGDNPGGSDARYEPEYARMLEEIEKLNSITHSQECRWDVVEEQACLVLRDKAKDFQAASYLAYAACRLHGLEGIADGAALLAGLVHDYWKTGFPVLKRVRGRVNALEWWRERMELALDALVADTDARFDPALLERLDTSLRSLDDGLAEQLPDFASLRGLLDRVRRLEPLEVAQAPEESAPQKAVPASPVHAAPAQAEAAPVQPAPGAGTQAPVQETAVPTAPAQSAAQPAPAPRAQETARLAAPAALSDNARENRRAFISYALSFAELERSADLSDPMPWLCTRAACFGPLRQLPPNQNGQIALPPPPEEIRTAQFNLFAAGNYEQTALACESLWPNHLFWLDAQYLVAQSLSRLGHTQAAQAVASSCALLVQRLAGLEKLCFNDGTPLASPDTRAWLASLQQGNGASGETAREDPVAACLASARKLFAEGRHAEALDHVDAQLATSARIEDRLALRLEQCRLLLRCEEMGAAALLCEDLVESLHALHVADWNRDLALDIARLARQVLPAAFGTAGPSVEQAQRLRDLERLMVRLRPSSLLPG